MMEEYPLTLAQVHAALAYYYDHQDEIEGYIKEDEAWRGEYEREKAGFFEQASSAELSLGHRHEFEELAAKDEPFDPAYPVIHFKPH
jgi:hypothetical protein